MLNQAYAIRSAIESDIPVIEGWLWSQPREAESLKENWATTLSVFREEGMLVYENSASKEPIAYFWGSLHSTDSILEVRHNDRNQGIGRVMLNHLMSKAVEEGHGLLRVHCATVSSVNFFWAMGFQLEQGLYPAEHVLATKVLTIPRRLPVSGKSAEVIVRFFSQSASYDKILPPLAVYRPVAKRTRAGRIWLAEKIACFDPQGSDHLMIELIVDGRPIYSGKATSLAAALHGVTKCENGYAIEKITP